MRGSLAAGVKLNPTKAISAREAFAFNPTDFDIDVYIISKKLHDEAAGFDKSTASGGQVKGSVHPQVRAIEVDMRNAVDSVEGNKDRGPNKWKFHVIIRTPENAKRTVEKDVRDVRGLGLPGRKFPGTHMTISPPPKAPNPESSSRPKTQSDPGAAPSQSQSLPPDRGEENKQ